LIVGAHSQKKNHVPFLGFEKLQLLPFLFLPTSGKWKGTIYFFGEQQCTISYCDRKIQNSFSNLIVGANIKHPKKHNFPH
jgi:hypothetical protein